MVTWDEIIKIEPGLRMLYDEVKQITDDKSKPFFCANRVWYGKDGIRSRMSKLVGFCARQDGVVIRSSDAYDLAYRRLYSLLPDCRNCNQCTRG